MLAVLSLMALLALPTLAALRLVQSFDSRVVVGYLGGVSVVTYWLYWRDKRKAETGDWRTPESTLHLAELLGGWPAAFLAQRVFRHKIAKVSYQVAFWAIVIAYEMAAFDFLHDWQYAREALRMMQVES